MTLQFYVFVRVILGIWIKRLVVVGNTAEILSRGRVQDQISYKNTTLSPYYLEEFLMRQPEIGNWFQFVENPDKAEDVIYVRCELGRGRTYRRACRTIS